MCSTLARCPSPSSPPDALSGAAFTWRRVLRPGVPPTHHISLPTLNATPLNLGKAGRIVLPRTTPAPLLPVLAAGRGPHLPAPWPADPMHSPSLDAAAAQALAALCDAIGCPAPLLRRALAGDVCRRLHERLLAAEASHAPHRTCRLAHTLAACVCALPRPHLSAATDSHKLLPMLLGWSELLHPPARAAVLHAVGHCVHELRAPEVQWHAALVLTRLRKLLVFRDACILGELLPALHRAHEAALPGLSDEQAREQTDELLQALEDEMLTVSDKPAARRLYALWLPRFFAPIGLALCPRLPSLVEHCCVLLDEEVGSSTAAFRAHGFDIAPATARRTLRNAVPFVRHAIRALDALLRAAWPRAPAHAAKALAHILAAVVRFEAMSQQITAGDGGTEVEPGAGELLLQAELAEFVRFIASCEKGSQVCASVIDLFLARAPKGAKQIERVSAALVLVRPGPGPQLALKPGGVA